jgi:hypothetical protein
MRLEGHDVKVPRTGEHGARPGGLFLDYEPTASDGTSGSGALPVARPSEVPAPWREVERINEGVLGVALLLCLLVVLVLAIKAQ